MYVHIQIREQNVVACQTLELNCWLGCFQDHAKIFGFFYRSVYSMVLKHGPCLGDHRLDVILFLLQRLRQRRGLSLEEASRCF